MKILGISGSLRSGSLNTRLLEAAAAALRGPHHLELADLRQIPLFNEDLEQPEKPPAVQGLLEQIAAADALLLATPEYNHSVPAVLKNALDWASRPAFKSVLRGKPAGILSAAPSPVGGARAQMHLQDILSSILTPVYPAPDYLLFVQADTFDSQGVLSDATAKRRLERFINEFAVWAGGFTA